MSPEPIQVSEDDDDEVVFVQESSGGVFPMVDLCADEGDCVEVQIQEPPAKVPHLAAEPAAVAGASNVSILSSPIQTPKMSCPICMDTIREGVPYSAVCGHVFCKECITRVVKEQKKCPFCSTKLTMTKVHPLYL